jgi:hypothetical protein
MMAESLNEAAVPEQLLQAFAAAGKASSILNNDMDTVVAGAYTRSR